MAATVQPQATAAGQLSCAALISAEPTKAAKAFGTMCDALSNICSLSNLLLDFKAVLAMVLVSFPPKSQSGALQHASNTPQCVTLNALREFRAHHKHGCHPASCAQLYCVAHTGFLSPAANLDPLSYSRQVHRTPHVCRAHVETGAKSMQEISNNVRTGILAQECWQPLACEQLVLLQSTAGLATTPLASRQLWQ